MKVESTVSRRGRRYCDDKKSRKSRVLDEVESEVMVFNPSGNAWLWYTRIEGE